MKRVLIFILTLSLVFCLCACDSDTENADANGGLSSSGEQAWTVKSATYTYPSGESYVCYTGDFTDNKFTMSFFSSRGKDKFDRDSMVFYCNSKGFTKIVTEEQDYGEDVEIEDETTFAYDPATETITQTTMEDGKLRSKEVYVLTWDDQDRLSKYTLTSTYHYYNDDGTENESERSEYISNYSYKYNETDFIVTNDEDYTVFSDGERLVITRRNDITVPYDTKANITTCETFLNKDGTPYNFTEDYDIIKSTSECNYWGYMLYERREALNGDIYKEEPNLTFDDEGKLLKAVKKTGDTNRTINFTYDENGNLTKMSWNSDMGEESIDFEWTKIPKKLNDQLIMYSGSLDWSVSEFIDNHVSFLYEGRYSMRTYKKADFLSYIS